MAIYGRGKTESVCVVKLRCLINGTVASGVLARPIWYHEGGSSVRLVCLLFYRPMPLLSTRHVSSCRRLPLGPEKPLYKDDWIVPRARGVRFYLVRSCSPIASSSVV